MIKNIFSSFLKWLKKPYYNNESIKYKILLSIGLGLVIFLFLFLFKPFGIEKVEEISVFAYCLGYFIMTTSVMLLYFFIVFNLFPEYFDNDNWTIGRYVFSLLCITITITVLSWFFNLIIVDVDRYNEDLGLLRIIRYTILGSIFPVLTYAFFDERHYRLKHMRIANEINKMIPQKKFSLVNKSLKEKIIKFSGTDDKKFTLINKNELILIKSQKNDIIFTLKQKNDTKQIILRKTISSVEEELKNDSNFFRCHKSYIVNTLFINRISGNARGYYFHISNTDMKIPVSRKFTKEELFYYTKI